MGIAHSVGCSHRLKIALNLQGHALKWKKIGQLQAPVTWCETRRANFNPSEMAKMTENKWSGR
jgi:hypothetical protein